MLSFMRHESGVESPAFRRTQLKILLQLIDRLEIQCDSISFRDTQVRLPVASAGITEGDTDISFAFLSKPL